MMSLVKEDLYKIEEKLVAIDKHLERNTTSLEHHIQRTKLAEERIARLEGWLIGALSAIAVTLVGNIVAMALKR